METKVPSLEQFHTRQKANEGVELPLTLPDGTPTDHVIRIRSVYSDAFRAADAISRRKLVEMSIGGEKGKVDEALAEEKLILLANLIISWTFETTLTVESATEFLREAPQIADQIDRLASRRSLFFRNGSTNSTTQPAPSLS